MAKVIDLQLQKPHPKQQEILDNAARFNHLRCGRRFGKTSLINRLCLPAVEGFPIGIFYPTHKDFSEVWKSIKSTYRELITEKNETLKQITLIGGGVIDFWSMDEPESGQGRKYKRVIIDESAKAPKLQRAWEETIRPTLTDYIGDAWIMSRPKPNTYFKQLEDDHTGRDEWRFFHYTTYDNPFIDPKEIEAAKNDLDPRTFDQEYLAEYVDPNAKYFLYSFDESFHVDDCQLQPHKPLKLSFDFNIDPFACLIYQSEGDQFSAVDSILLPNSDIYQMCDHIRAKYPADQYFYTVTGDRTGYNQTGMKRGKTSYWKIIKQELRLIDSQIRLRSKNLDLIESRVLCNSAFTHKDILIDPSLKQLIHECKYSIVDDRGVLIKDRKKNKNDIFDCLRYALDCEYPNLTRRPL